MADGEETSRVYDSICINPCKWFEQAFKATLRCFGFDSVITPESPQAGDDDQECLTTDQPLIMAPNGSDGHEDKQDQDHNPVITSADSRCSSSSSSSSSSSGDDHRDQQADLNPSTTDPSTELSPPSVLALGRRSRVPPRPPVGSGRGGQTN